MRRGVRLSLAGLSFAIAAPCNVRADQLSAPALLQHDASVDPIAEAAARFGLPVAWIRAVFRAESDGDQRSTSPKGAMGLMQIMPETWAELRARLALGNDPYDPHNNVLAGAAYMRELLDRYGTPGWIAAYNAGPGRYEAFLKGTPLPPETRAYVTALAPIIDGGAPVGPVQIASLDPLAWTQAPLFAVSLGRDVRGDSLAAGQQAESTPLASAVRDVSAIVPQSAGLFVARAGSGGRP